MVDSSVRFQPATLPEAARILGVSQSTVRRLVKAGKLEAERVLRPQGHVWMVRVPSPSTDPPEDPPRWIPPSPANPPEQPAAPPALTAWVTSVLEPLVLELGTSRQRIEDLARENGRQAAELERAASTIVALGEEIERLKAPAEPAVEARETAVAPDPPPQSPAGLLARPVYVLALLALVAPLAVAVWVLVIR